MAKQYKYKNKKENGRNETGRPTKLTPEILEKVIKYFNEYEPWYECPVEKQDKDGSITTKMERVANPPPCMFDLTKILDVSRKTIWEWSRDNEEFRTKVHIH